MPPERLGDYLRAFNKLNKRFGYTTTLYGHFGDGCVHARMTFGLKTAEGVAKFRRVHGDAPPTCDLKYGGSLSGEHGDGQAKGELLPQNVWRRPDPGVSRIQIDLGPPLEDEPGQGYRRASARCRSALGPDYAPARRRPTHFQYPNDDCSFAKRWSAASASANAAPSAAAYVSEFPGHA